MNQSTMQQALEALRAVVNVADRATAEFDLAHAAIAALEKELAMRTREGEVEQVKVTLQDNEGYCQACIGSYCTARDGCVAMSNPPMQKTTP